VRHWLAVTAVALVVGLLVVWRPLAPDDSVHAFSGPTMGTTFTVSVDADLSAEERERIQAAIEAGLDRITRLMSTYEPGSEVSQFNAHADTTPFALDPEVLEVLTLAREVSERSEGAFDVTVAPLVDAWGFGATDPVGSLPDQARVEELLAYVGFDRLAVDPGAGTASKPDPRMRIDLSGIAQGYASDVVAAALTELGYTDFLVDVGGELRASGTRRSGRAWRVGIESPDAAAPVWGTVELGDEGVATSGDYRNWFEDGGVRYAHIIDPHTGRPIPVRGASVTVVHRSAAMADAWATALCVLGPEAGFELAERVGVAAAFITGGPGGVEARLTPAMSRRSGLEEPEG